MLLAAAVRASQVSEADRSPSGARVLSVEHDPARGRIRIGFSDGSTLDLTAEHRVLVVLPGRASAIFVHGASRARDLRRVQ